MRDTYSDARKFGRRDKSGWQVLRFGPQRVVSETIFRVNSVADLQLQWPKWRARRDSNSRPPGSKPGALSS